MKHIEVVAAIIRDGSRILAVQRGYGEFKGRWEFPGGKIEPFESKEAALKREMQEELHADIEIEEFALTVDHTYDHFHVTMHCYLATTRAPIELLEHMDAKWLGKEDLFTVDWLEADVPVAKYMEAIL